MKPLAICHVLWSVEVGGAERVVLDLAKVQRAAGHRVAVLSLSSTQGAMAGQFQSVVETLEAVPKGPRGTDLTLPVRLARWFRSRRIDVVHTHNELPLIYGALGGKLARAVVIHSKHGVVPVSRGAHLLRRAAATAVDRFVAVSASTAETARANHECTPGKLRVVINGTDLSRFPARESREVIRRELGIPTDARVLVTVGRLVREKNHALLIRATAPLLREDRHLVIVGAGVLEAELRKQAADLPEGRFIHLTGGRHDIPALLAAADAYGLSSDTEGLPIGLLEAWASVLPVVATSVGGIPAAVRHEDTGILVPSRDEAALRAGLKRILEPDDAITTMAERGRAHVLATYSAETMAGAYQALYEECL